MSDRAEYFADPQGVKSSETIAPWARSWRLPGGTVVLYRHRTARCEARNTTSVPDTSSR